MQLSLLNEGLYDLNKTYIGKSSNGMLVYTIDPEYFRTYLDVDYADGGHHLVYPQIIPKKEIWLDETLNPRDRKAILIHELTEHMLMFYFGLTYKEAHNRANNIERMFRDKFKLHQ